jgi:4-aminobutyrate aminotransferase-like enzyme
VTRLEEPPPIFWQRASGSNVWDVDGNRFLDLTAAFGVANVGHAHPGVVGALTRQSETLLHAMGDVHPPSVKVELLEALAARFPGGEPARAVLGSSGSDAVECALKTAQLASGRPGLLAFEGAYHGLALGALDATARSDFRDPFAARLPGATLFARFGDIEDARKCLAHAAAAERPLGAVMVEPVQGRGGDRIPPRGFLAALRALCDEHELLLIADEIYTGFGRTGRWLACEHEDVVPDLLCLGKGLASGMPISACVGRRKVMDAWPKSTGEALHTQTFLGHPAGCAAALASMAAIEREGLVERARTLGLSALERLRAELGACSAVAEVRGLGLMIGIEFTSGRHAAEVAEESLQKGVIVLPAGPEGGVLSITPPLSIDPPALDHALAVVVEACRGRSARRFPASGAGRA